MAEETLLQSRINAFKLTLRFMGATVNLSFIVMSCWFLSTPNTDTFWSFCQWFGKGALGIFVGIAGCYMEFKGSMAKVAQNFSMHALNRIALCMFYFWLGCYVISGLKECGREDLTAEWQSLGHATGIVAWVVACGDLVVSCLHDKSDAEEPPVVSDAEACADGRAEVSVARQPTGATPMGGWNSGGVKPTAPSFHLPEEDTRPSAVTFSNSTKKCDPAEAQQPNGAAGGGAGETKMQMRIRSSKIGLRVMGTVVNVSFAVMSVWFLAHPNTDNFYDFCQYLGKASLGIFVSAGGCYMEVKGARPKIAGNFLLNALQRLFLTMFYFWLGCYVMSGVELCGSELSDEWRSLGNTTGLLAWVVAAGDLVTACLHERHGGDEQVMPPSAKAYKVSQPAEEPSSSGASPASGPSTEPDRSVADSLPLPADPQTRVSGPSSFLLAAGSSFLDHLVVGRPSDQSGSSREESRASPVTGPAGAANTGRSGFEQQFSEFNPDLQKRHSNPFENSGNPFDDGGNPFDAPSRKVTPKVLGNTPTFGERVPSQDEQPGAEGGSETPASRSASPSVSRQDHRNEMFRQATSCLPCF